jgi:hypothetical protein
MEANKRKKTEDHLVKKNTCIKYDFGQDKGWKIYDLCKMYLCFVFQFVFFAFFHHIQNISFLLMFLLQSGGIVSCIFTHVVHEKVNKFKCQMCLLKGDTFHLKKMVLEVQSTTSKIIFNRGTPLSLNKLTHSLVLSRISQIQIR